MKFIKLLALSLLLNAPCAAKAGDFGNWALASVFGYNIGQQNFAGTVNNFNPPYFSMHPPVYYGQRFYRPYGESPIASWPQLQANPSYMPRAHVAQGNPIVIENAFCPADIPVTPLPSDAAPAPAVPDVVRTGPITIENPYYRQSSQLVGKGDEIH